jgi:cellulose synthase/poly-beta-1,6-N-acetylglucosamine synthase-like glycosyltransferase
LNFELGCPNFSLGGVNEPLPSVTVLIAARPGQADIKAVTASRLLDYPREKLEIIVARGKQPSVQRNTASREARGELIYFLDDDSMPPPENLRRAVQAFADPKVKMLGGPNICPGDAPLLEQVFALVHASWLAFGPSRARYTPVGAVRESSEKELILCNLMTRRDAMLEAGGFNEALYPNEENALMDELQKRGGKLLYDPEFIVHRRPRNNLGAFAKMLRNYGRGRAEQFRLQPTLGSAPNFVPPLFCVYLLALVILFVSGHTTMLPWLLIPLFFYGFALLGQAAVLAGQGGLLESVLAIPLMFLTHLLYGVGFWRGLFTPLKPAEREKIPVTIERISL